MTTSFTTTIITSNDGFDALETSWRQLSSSSRASIFQSYSWCREWWRVYGSRLQAAIITVSDGDRLVGLLPLCLAGSYHGLPLKRGFLIGTGTIDYGGALIADSADEADVWKEIWGALTTLPWDALDIYQLPVSTPALSFFDNMSDAITATVIPQETTYPASLTGSIEEFRAGLSKKFRTNIDYNHRRLERESKLEFRYSSTDVHADIETFFDLHQRLWQKKHMPGAFYSQKRRHFHRSVAADLARHDNLRLAFLLVDGAPVASVYGFKERETFYYYLGGYEPVWAPRSVSTLLIYDLIADAIKDGCRVFDFLRGEEDYKQRWGAEPAEISRLIVARSTRKAVLLKRLLLSENKVTTRVKTWLARR